MICTQRIKTITQKPIKTDDFETVNVMNWHNKWKELSPYYLRTDATECNLNEGGIIFENFWQGSKIFDIVYPIEVYASAYHKNNPKYLWWKYDTVSEYDILYNKKTKVIDYELYSKWRTSLWNCQNPIRYPNGINNRKRTQFSVLFDFDNNESRLGYIDARKKLYVNEYMRLVRKTNTYKKLLALLNNDVNLIICEIDVPSHDKKSVYGQNCDDHGNYKITNKRLDILINDPAEAFGHGLCLSKALLEDKKLINKIT
jgi:hypothetical protein